MTDDPRTSTPTRAPTSLDLAARNTGLAIQRTRMSAERTLMAVIRTSLSLLSFGFTISQIFDKLTEGGVLRGNSAAGQKFGIALVAVGITMLVIGIVYHVQFMLSLRGVRTRMVQEGTLAGKSPFPVSLTLITAVILLAIGILAIASMAFHVGPFE